jgi:hypothetical protein
LVETFAALNPAGPVMSEGEYWNLVYGEVDRLAAELVDSEPAVIRKRLRHPR